MAYVVYFQSYCLSLHWMNFAEERDLVFLFTSIYIVSDTIYFFILTVFFLSFLLLALPNHHITPNAFSHEIP